MEPIVSEKLIIGIFKNQEITYLLLALILGAELSSGDLHHGAGVDAFHILI